jgi:hypothetical protein
LVLAQVLGDSEAGDFLLLPNRLANSRLTTSGANAKQTLAENADTVESIIKTFKHFCHDEEALRMFYAEADKPKAPVAPSPFSQATMAADLDVPPMSLPQHLLQRAPPQEPEKRTIMPRYG